MTKDSLRDSIIKKQDELIARKCKHRSDCWLNQNWDEAKMAMADTPDKFRDAGYYEALQEIETKSQTCSCGLNDIQSELTSLKAELNKEKVPYEIDWSKYGNVKSLPPKQNEKIVEYAYMPSGRIVVIAGDEISGIESYWFDNDGNSPLGTSLIFEPTKGID